MSNQVTRTERGWPGHFICADRCLFRRNTLLQYEDTRIVVSTVGLMRELARRDSAGFEPIGYNRYYETMAFHANWDGRYWDNDVTREVSFQSNWAINKLDADDRANDMHEAVVAEITQRMESGEKFLDNNLNDQKGENE